ncbi:hypothetical protein [Streptacidiphilus cavernicola]|uniref:Uncharacterized protein n=1 Tax=Streptacidiphilus cavernicola TaxID=3342716 RepID=A0ABV6UP64_9ACTN
MADDADDSQLPGGAVAARPTDDPGVFTRHTERKGNRSPPLPGDDELDL